MTKRWKIAPFDSARVSELAKSAAVPNIVAQLLLRRGIHDEATAKVFLDCKMTSLHDPEELPGAVEAAALLAEAVESKQRIIIYGDYDADGMTSTSILVLCLRAVGGDVGYYVPSRTEEGYGVNSDALRKLAKDGADVVVTVDCGITSVEEARVAKEIGLTLIISDHHEMTETLPEADVLVHPRLPGYPATSPHLCGAGVALKIAWALCQKVSGTRRVSERLKNFLMQAMGLAAIGTVADVVPLVDENRVIVRHGLTSLKNWPTVGIAALAKIAKINSKPAYDSEDIGFTLGPRLNAAGRLGQALLAIELLTTDDPERAQSLAEYLDELNKSRQSLERSIKRSAKKQAEERFDIENDAALVLADYDWHPGVIGIVAGQLAEKFNRPVVLIALDAVGARPGAGSARSVPGLNLHEALASCTEHLISHGGHAAAAGLKINPKRIDEFREAFCEYVSEQLSSGDATPELAIDGETAFSELTMRTLNQINSLAPFGSGNTRPIFCSSNVTVAGEVKRIGNGGRHLSMTFDQQGTRIRAVAFGIGESEEDFANHKGTLSVAFKPVINNFRGRSTVEMHLADWRMEE